MMNKFVDAIDGFKKPKIFYTDTDSLYMRQEDADILQSLGMIGDDLGQVKSETFPHYIQKAIFLGPKQKILILSNGECKVSFKGIDYENQKSLTFENFLSLAKNQENEAFGKTKETPMVADIQ